VSLPDSLHCEWSIAALEAGKHVLCEKPLGRRVADVEAAFDAADRSGCLLMEALMYRHHPQTLRLEELVGGGAIGPLVGMRESFTVALRDPANIRMRRDLDGGALAGIGCYCVSSARLLAGEPERVYGEQLLGATGVDVRFHGVMRFRDGVVAQFDTGVALPARHGLEVVGADGTILVRDPWYCRSPSIELTKNEGTTLINVDAANSYELQIRNFAAAVRGEAAPLLGRDDALGQARTIEALYEAAGIGEVVGL
jgi:predicted dehydrogenase